MFKYLIVWLHVVTPAGAVHDGALISMQPAEQCEDLAIKGSIETNVVKTGCASGNDVDIALDQNGCTQVSTTEINGLPASILSCRKLPK